MTDDKLRCYDFQGHLHLSSGPSSVWESRRGVKEWLHWVCRSTCPAGIISSHSKECLTDACTAVLKMCAAAYCMNRIWTKSITEYIMLHYYYYLFCQATHAKSYYHMRSLILKSLVLKRTMVLAISAGHQTWACNGSPHRGHYIAHGPQSEGGLQRAPWEFWEFGQKSCE